MKPFLLSLTLLFPTVAAAAPTVQYFPLGAPAGTSKAVIVGPATLAHTTQILPLDAEGRVPDKGQPAAQVRRGLDNLDGALKAAGSKLERSVKINVYATSNEVVAEVNRALAKRFPGEVRPTVSYVVGKLSHPDALVALDAVAVAEDAGKAVKFVSGDKASGGRVSAAALLPPGPRVYVAGQAEKGATPAEATRKTLAGLKATLKFLGLNESHVVQAKAFLTPITAADEVTKEFEAFFGKGKVPPLAFVEWQSTLPIEIELVAASPAPKRRPFDEIEYLTPPGMTASPVYSRIARVHAERTIYVGGLYAARPGDGAAQVADVFAQLGKVLETTGSDFRYLAKATYYVSDEDASRKLNELRPKYYDPRRPPAASKAMVPGVGVKGRTITLDMIAVPSTLRSEGKPEIGHGLSAEDAADGWISLFDGKTAFGWAGAKVENGVLTGGATDVRFGNCALRAVFERGGTLEAGGKRIAVKPGPFSLPKTGGRGPIRLLDGAAVTQLAVRPLGLKTIPPGPGLPGWKRLDHPTLPEKKRPTWKVVDGGMEAIGGPGALEYSERFGDVVIQAEVRSLNRHANGGIFFRCIPGDFMNGYEAQIHSASIGGDPSKPAEYATGGIDDRQNARRLVSRDFVPSVMTVIADGPRIATWVNGVQVTDWLDTRAKDPNPRRGLRVEPGTIQIQAHDAATDLEYRKVAVAGW